MSKIYLVAVLCMVSAAAAVPIYDGLTPRPKLPAGSEDVITHKPNDLKPTVQNSKESEAEASKEQPQPNKVDELNVDGGKTKGNKDSKEPQKGETSKELNKPDHLKESGEDKKKGPSSKESSLVKSGEDKKNGPSSEELDKDHGHSGEKRPEERKNPLLFMSYLNWLLSQSLPGSRSDYYDQPPSEIIELPIDTGSQELLY